MLECLVRLLCARLRCWNYGEVVVCEVEMLERLVRLLCARLRCWKVWRGYCVRR